MAENSIKTKREEALEASLKRAMKEKNKYKEDCEKLAENQDVLKNHYENEISKLLEELKKTEADKLESLDNIKKYYEKESSELVKNLGIEILGLKESNSTLQSEILCIKESLELNKAELSRYQLIVNEKDIIINDLMEKNQITGEINMDKQKETEFSQKFDEQEKYIDALKQAIEEMKEANSISLNEKEQFISSLQQEVKLKGELILKFETEKDDMAKEMLSLKEMKSIQAKIQKKQNQEKALIENSMKEIEETKTELQNQLKQVKESEDCLREKITLLESRETTLLSQKQQFDNDMQAFQENYQRIQSEIVEKDANISTLSEMNRKRGEDIESLKNQIEDSTSAINQLVEKCSTLENEISNLIDINKSQKLEIEQNKNQMNEMRETISILNSEISDKSQTINNIRNEIIELEEKLDIQIKISKKLEFQLKEAKDNPTLDELKRRIQILETENEKFFYRIQTLNEPPTTPKKTFVPKPKSVPPSYLKKTILQFFLQDDTEREPLIPVILSIVGCDEKQITMAKRKWNDRNIILNRKWFI